MEDSQSVAGFVGQLCYLVGPGEVITDGKTEEFNRLNLLQWLTMEIGGSVLQSLQSDGGETEICQDLIFFFQLSDNVKGEKLVPSNSITHKLHFKHAAAPFGEYNFK